MTDEIDWTARLTRAGRRYHAAKLEIRELAIAAIADGYPEAATARALGIDRMTLRRWQGKRK